jgi:hypothetical protein
MGVVVSTNCNRHITYRVETRLAGIETELGTVDPKLDLILERLPAA